MDTADPNPEQDVLQIIYADHAGCTGPTRQHELDHTYKFGNRSALKELDREAGIDYLSAISSESGLAVICRRLCALAGMRTNAVPSGRKDKYH